MGLHNVNVSETKLAAAISFKLDHEIILVQFEKNRQSTFFRQPEVMHPLQRHFRGQDGLKTVVRSNFSPEIAEK